MANNRKRRPRKDDRAYDRRFDRRKDDDMPSGRRNEDARNDISWYSKYPNLLTAAGSFPFPYRPGMELPITNTVWRVPMQSASDENKNNPIEFQFTIPGVMALDWAPSVGKSNSPTDPASILGKEIYARVRQAYSGSLEADGPDFVVYLMALDSIFSYLAWLKRAYRVMNSWTPENYVLPDVVLSAMGLCEQDILNLRTNRMQFWQIINELVLMSRKFTCPALMDIFNRHYWMSDNVYTDAPEINSQFYLFNLRAVYQFAMLNMKDGNPGPGLQLIQMPTVRSTTGTTPVYITPQLLYEFGRSLIDALVEWDEAYTINGYLMRAFEGSPTFIVDELPADQPFNPVYEEEVLVQIENSRGLLNYSLMQWEYCDFNVTQDVPTNSIISNPLYNALDKVADRNSADLMVGIKPMLSIRSATPTVADNTIASRLQATLQIQTFGAGTSTIYTVDAGTEIPFGWRIVLDTFTNPSTWPTTNVYEQVLLYYIRNNTDPAVNPSNVNQYLIRLMTCLNTEQFDWHPFGLFMYAWAVPTNPSAQKWYLAVNGDTHNATVISNEDLENLHKICLYSELNAFNF